VNAGACKFGSAVVTHDEWSAVAPVDAGRHSVTFLVTGTENYDGLRLTLEYTIEGRASAGGKEYETVEEAVKAANSKTPVTFAETPTIDNGRHEIVPAGGSPVNVPSYYDISLDGNTVSLTLNSSAVPQVTAGTVQTEDGKKSVPAFEVDAQGVASVGTTTIKGLYYALKSGTTLTNLTVQPGTKWVKGDGGVMQLQSSKPEGGASQSGFYRVVVTDVAK